MTSTNSVTGSVNLGEVTESSEAKEKKIDSSLKQQYPSVYLDLLTEVTRKRLEKGKAEEESEEKQKAEGIEKQDQIAAACLYFDRARFQLRAGDLVFKKGQEIASSKGQKYMSLVPRVVRGVSVKVTQDKDGQLVKSGAYLSEEQEEDLSVFGDGWDAASYKVKRAFAVLDNDTEKTLNLIQILYPDVQLVVDQIAIQARKEKRKD